MGEFTDKVKGAANETAAKVKNVVADATNDPDLKAEAAAQSLKGKAQKAVGSIKGALGDKV